MIQELQNKLYNEIPLTKMMELQIKDYNINELITTAPLEPNINDKGTAFGGSLSTLSIISAWSVCWLVSRELGFDSNNIVIIKNETSFRKPVIKKIICHTKKPSIQEIEILKQKLENKKSASIKIESQIIENGEICVDFVGYYVIKV
jgi:thioesterase domain-containing protein